MASLQYCNQKGEEDESTLVNILNTLNFLHFIYDLHLTFRQNVLSE